MEDGREVLIPMIRALGDVRSVRRGRERQGRPDLVPELQREAHVFLGVLEREIGGVVAFQHLGALELEEAVRPVCFIVDLHAIDGLLPTPRPT